MSMVLLRSLFLLLERSCPWSKFSSNSNQLQINNYYITYKPKTFSTSSNFKASGKQPTKAEIDSFQPQVEVHLGANRLIKPFFFTVAFSTASISGAAIWEYENNKPTPVSWKTFFKKYFSTASICTAIWQSENNMTPFSWKTFFRDQKYVGNILQELRNSSHRFWNELNAATQIFIPICIANLLVFCAWRIPALQTTMFRYFCSNPAIKNNCWPMVLSTFSHFSTLHIFGNMYVLQKFSTAATLAMGKEQFLGFYLAAGVIASYASYIHNVIAQRPGLSLGASGSIMAVLGYTCVSYPDMGLSIVLFKPLFTIKASMALKVIMGVDLAGILLGWRFTDHAAHLGGAAFGIFWCLYGNQYIWQKREVLIKHWRTFRRKTS